MFVKHVAGLVILPSVADTSKKVPATPTAHLGRADPGYKPGEEEDREKCKQSPSISTLMNQQMMDFMYLLPPLVKALRH